MLALLARTISVICWCATSLAVNYVFFRISIVLGILVIAATIVFMLLVLNFFHKEKKQVPVTRKYPILDYLN